MKFKNNSFLFLFFLFSFTLQAQPFCVGVDLNATETPVAYAPASGTTSLVLTDEGNVHRLDGVGSSWWSRNYNTPQATIQTDIIEVFNGNFMLMSQNGILTEIEPFSGNVINTLPWEDDPNLEDERLKTIIQTSDSGFVLCGSARKRFSATTDMYIVKLKPSGGLEWAKLLGGEGNEDATHVIETANGVLVVAGFTESFGAGSRDVYAGIFTLAGGLITTRTFGDASANITTGLIETNSGFLISTRQELLRINGAGNLTNVLTWTGFTAAGLVPRAPRFVLFGEVPNGTDANIGVVLFNGSAQVIAAQQLGTADPEIRPMRGTLLTSNEFAFTALRPGSGASPQRSVAVTKLDGGGLSCCGSPFSFTPVPGIFTQDTGGVLTDIITQQRNPVSTNTNLTPVINDLCFVPRLAVNDATETGLENMIQMHPNPANDWLLITLEIADQPATIVIVDAKGRTVLRQRAEQNNTQIDVSTLANGYYTVRIEHAADVVHQSLVVLH
ncbi:MAG: T9SS type A sorting domain-containing protein [Salibacteraceae bacterium]